MARITITTDWGEVVETFSDVESEIGDLSKKAQSVHFLDEVGAAIGYARRRENRTSSGDRRMPDVSNATE